MRRIYVGTFYGYKLKIEIPKMEDAGLPEKYWLKKFTDWLNSERRGAVQLYKSEQKMKFWSNLLNRK